MYDDSRKKSEVRTEELKTKFTFNKNELQTKVRKCTASIEFQLFQLSIKLIIMHFRTKYRMNGTHPTSLRL